MENHYKANRDINIEYGIDLFEIYENERNLFLEDKITHTELRHIYYFIEDFFIKSNPEPIIEISYEIDAPHRIYTDKILTEINEFKKGIGTTYSFFNRDKIYDIAGNHICIFNPDINPIDFEKLFAYSLRTYENKLSEINPFLDFHLASNFENISRNFHRFLEIVLTQHNALLSKKIEKFVRIWMQENPEIIQHNSAIPKKNIIESNTISFEKENEFIEASIEEIPENYKVVDLKISRINTMIYFSFLYTTIDKNEEPIISKKDFIEVFKYGIALPPHPINQIVKLNLKGLKVGSINYAIFIFFEKYAKSVKQKREIMTFFGYQFDYFHNRIITTAAFNSWNKNLTASIKPKKLGIEIPDISPEQ